MEASMYAYEEYAELFRQFGEECLGVSVTSWVAHIPSIGLKGWFNPGEWLDRWGETSTIFESLTEYERIVSRSLSIPLEGEGSGVDAWIDASEFEELCWTPAQEKLIEKWWAIVATYWNELERDIRRLDDFMYKANEEEMLSLPEALSSCVECVTRLACGWKHFEIDSNLSLDYEYADQAMDDVLEGRARIGSVCFEHADGDVYETERPVAWPVEKEGQFLLGLYQKLGGPLSQLPEAA
jgi:hypothetical protein